MKKIYISTLCLLAMAGCSNVNNKANVSASDIKSAVCSNQNLAGGWAQSKLNSESKEALNFALKSVGIDPSLVKVLSVRSQVVNGMNYAIDFKDQNDEIYHAVVYRSLKGKMNLNQPVQQGKICP
ncbi:cystatin domain-containing protein [Vibrio hannami]|uniref:cystatin domain-containing protein n=1 Tax=Vibrio hannami TaxID=2717094 RepID=UPI00240FB596|nr:cystatin domain-containing protein [Vibrio hannami]MDG3084805.1 cystatin domain-containing protein [Vibrio hannami]